MKAKTGRSLRYMLCLWLTILILFSLHFAMFIDWLGYAQAFEEYDLLYAWRPGYEPVQQWVKTVSFIFTQVWHWIVGIICIFVIWRFIWYPKVLLTDEFKDSFKIRRKKHEEKNSKQTKLF